MKAIRFHEYGGPEVLRFEDAPRPEIADDEVLVRVAAAAVNPADWQIRRGDYRDFLPLTLPFVPGADLAGTVEASGSCVDKFRAGDAVFAMTDLHRDGGYAEYVAVHATALALAPGSLPLHKAASVPLCALTAWKALFDHGDLKAGQRVLIHAGAGGVGIFAIQLARLAGARVIATASAASHDMLRHLGADELIDYTQADFSDRVDPVDLVLDMVGGETRESSWRVLRAGGMLVAVAMPPPVASEIRDRGLRSAMVQVTPDGERLAEIAALFDAGRLVTAIDREYPLQEAATAQKMSESRRARGKILLRVS